MNILKKMTLKALVFLFLSAQFTVQAEIASEETSPFVLMTVPKSGSHLTIKALHFLTGGICLWHTHFPSLYTVPPQEGFLYTHLCITPQLEADYSALPALKRIINVRDFRDVCVSIVHQICKAPWPGMPGEERDKFKALSFEEQLLYVFNYEYELKEIAKIAPNNLQVSVSKLAEQMVRLSREPNTFVCRYENLVGPEGGGTQAAQWEELERIAEFLSIRMPPSDIRNIASKLYGNEVNPFGGEGFENFKSTFNNGQIGKWREVFTDQHKQVFKERFGYVLTALGYEYDNNW